MDHAIPASLGGTNAIHSYVLACARCNGDEKREEPWASFLERKSQQGGELQSRRKRIEEWISASASTLIDAETRTHANEIIEAALASFDKSVAEMRRLRREA